jgi:predicted metalloprotease
VKLDDVEGDDSGIEDRRGQGGGSGGFGMGGGGLPIPIGKGKGGVGILVVLVIMAVLGKSCVGGGGGGGGNIDIGDVLGQMAGGQSANIGEAPVNASPNKDAQYQFVADVRELLKDYWQGQFTDSKQQFQPAGLVIFDAPTQTGGCGVGQPEAGPFYCPGDSKIYIDFTFYSQLESMLGFDGDFAMAYVVAHEYGHHIQNLLGINDQVERAGRSNENSVKLELQADCFAGAWAKSAFEDKRLEAGDFEEAMNAAKSVGDDAIQKKTQGSVDRDAWTHGSSADRQKWFKTGFDTADPSKCDTFA